MNNIDQFLLSTKLLPSIGIDGLQLMSEIYKNNNLLTTTSLTNNGWDKYRLNRAIKTLLGCKAKKSMLTGILNKGSDDIKPLAIILTNPSDKREKYLKLNEVALSYITKSTEMNSVVNAPLKDILCKYDQFIYLDMYNSNKRFGAKLFVNLLLARCGEELYIHDLKTLTELIYTFTYERVQTIASNDQNKGFKEAKKLLKVATNVEIFGYAKMPLYTFANKTPARTPPLHNSTRNCLIALENESKLALFFINGINFGFNGRVKRWIQFLDRTTAYTEVNFEDLNSTELLKIVNKKEVAHLPPSLLEELNFIVKSEIEGSIETAFEETKKLTASVKLLGSFFASGRDFIPLKEAIKSRGRSLIVDDSVSIKAMHHYQIPNLLLIKDNTLILSKEKSSKLDRSKTIVVCIYNPPLVQGVYETLATERLIMEELDSDNVHFSYITTNLTEMVSSIRDMKQLKADLDFIDSFTSIRIGKTRSESNIAILRYLILKGKYSIPHTSDLLSMPTDRFVEVTNTGWDLIDFPKKV